MVGDEYTVCMLREGTYFLFPLSLAGIERYA
jgi:hypothetical protein